MKIGIAISLLCLLLLGLLWVAISAFNKWIRSYDYQDSHPGDNLHSKTGHSNCSSCNVGRMPTNDSCTDGVRHKQGMK